MDLSKQLSEEKFGKMAESYQIHELEETCKMITENESLFNDLGLTCLNYVLNTNRITSIKKIEWINHFYQPYLTNESISQKIFLFLLSLRFEEQDLMDIELYQLMSNTFPKVAPSTTELWEQALMPFMEKMKQQVSCLQFGLKTIDKFFLLYRREEFSDIIDSYLYDPSIHPNINTHDDLAIISSYSTFCANQSCNR
ncbi:hypothetical protein BD560DRAFT_142121 [Blakeslea trispora]|nr:hypothetical protein BD560DRAFT_142121 [Blakeslea trispora]